MTEIKPGDEVRLFQRTRRRGIDIPAGGLPGRVTKVGKRYATAVFQQEWTDSGGTKQQSEFDRSFDMESGYVRADTEGFYVRTLEQADQDARRKEALYWLDLAGLEPKLGRANFIPLAQLEAMSEIVKTLDRKEQDQ